MVDDSGKAVFSCVLWKDVKCPFRKYESLAVMGRCFRCREYKRFMAESEERDAREDDEAREILSHPELYPDGVLS